MPCLDSETEEYLNQEESQKDNHSRMKKKLQDCYRHGGRHAEDLHLACTLDQSYYMSLPDTFERDKQQVVYRYYSGGRDTTERKPKKAATTAKNRPHRHTAAEQNMPNMEGLGNRTPKSERLPKILMVNQLWLWKLDSSKSIS